jgi:pimeloyl-ACP methyl ester carboxylesterase
VLLCYPVGSEYMRAHRAFRQLNTLLSRAGANVLRFDYSCTGDSAGNGVDATVEAWLEDVDWALDELKDTAASESVSVVGLRMGAALAALASRKREDVAHLVLWDPIVSGREYLDEVIGNPRPAGVIGVEGFPMSPTLRTSLDAIDLTRADSLPQAGRTSILVSSEHQASSDLADAMRRAQEVVNLEVVPSSGSWAQADPFGDALIPQNIIQAIVDRLQTQTVA